MNKIKKYYVNTTQAILAMFLVLNALFALGLPAPRTFAADPGCYQVIGTTTQDDVIRTYTQVNCEDRARTVEVSNGACFVATVSANMNGQTVGEYRRADCSTFNVGQTTTPKPETPYESVELDCDVDEGQSLNRSNCGIINYLVILINFLSAVAIMAIVASVMFAGYQYMTARDNPGAVTAAKKRIVWALVALGLFVFGYGLLNFLVPGGVL